MGSLRACWKVRAFQLRAFRAGSFLGARQSHYVAFYSLSQKMPRVGKSLSAPFLYLFRADPCNRGGWGRAFRASLKDFE